MNRQELLLICIAGIAVAGAGGCGDSSSNGGLIVPPESTGLLRKVTGSAELEASIKEGLTTIHTEQTASLDASAAAGFTGTYTQEPNVDEFDAVRYDGTHLYIAPQRSFNCCFVLANAGDGGDPPDVERSIRILATDPNDGSASLAGTIPLEDDISVQGMYLADDLMVALTGRAIYGSYGDFWAEPAIWAPEQMGVSIYDTSDPAAPVRVIEAEIDGIFVESRRVGDTVYIVSRYTPAIDGLVYHVTTAAEQAQNEAILANVSLNDLLPGIKIGASRESLVDPAQCFVTTDDDNSGYPVITSITAIPIGDPNAFKTTCYNEDAYGIYVSESAIYLTALTPNAPGNTRQTRVHKFRLSDTDLDYRGSADIIGEVWRGGQADFRMNEFKGDLRVFASEWDSNNADFVDHRLYVMRESANDLKLDIVSTLPNANRPQEIGKPNEALYGVRFAGERAYAVTFLQIDPLYVVDLSDPTDPRLAGALEVTGFSDFLHPVTENLLLGLGQDATGGVKLELFDITDMARPLSRGSTTLGGPGSYSEARYDRHAFTYQADVDGIDRFALPAEVYADDGTYNFVEAGLYLFEIRDKTSPNIASLYPVGSMLPSPAGNGGPQYRTGRHRSFIHDDTVYYIGGSEVWAAFWNSPSILNGPF